MTSKNPNVILSRRAFLKLSSRLAAGAAITSPLMSFAAPITRRPLSFYHTHTGETLNLEINPEHPCVQTRKTINRFLRDFRTGEIHPIDPQLLDLLCRIQKIGGSSGTFEVISGYRSPATNSLLRKRSGGVAKKSLHMLGQAIDIRLTDIKTETLRDIAWSMRKGGVGYYAKSNFVHIDTGRPRTW